MNLNRGAYKARENQWSTALQNGSSDNAQVEVIYDGFSLRPAYLDVTYSIDVVTDYVLFKNAPGGQ